MHKRRQCFRSALGITTGDYVTSDLAPGVLQVIRISDPAFTSWNTGIAVVRTWPVVTLYCQPACGAGPSVILGDVRMQNGEWFTDINQRVVVIRNAGLPIGSAHAVRLEAKDPPVLASSLNHLRPAWYCPICRFVWTAPAAIRQCRSCGFDRGIQKAALLGPRPEPPIPASGAWGATRLALALHRADGGRVREMRGRRVLSQSRSSEHAAILVKPEPESRGRVNGIEI